jgi:hypothetical protein
LHVVDTDSGILIDGKDAYIPVNMYVDGDGARASWHIGRPSPSSGARPQSFGEYMERNARGYDIKVSLGGAG